LKVIEENRRINEIKKKKKKLETLEVKNEETTNEIPFLFTYSRFQTKRAFVY